MSKKPEQLAWDAERACDYCERMFRPKRAQDRKQHFCCDDHRKRYFEYGARMHIVGAITRLVRRDIEQLQKRIASLERQVKNPSWRTPSVSEVRKRIRGGGVDTKREVGVTFNPESTEVME